MAFALNARDKNNNNKSFQILNRSATKNVDHLYYISLVDVKIYYNMPLCYTKPEIFPSKIP